MKMPEIGTLHVSPSTIDEWYGVEVRVEWTEPFDYRAYRDVVHAEQMAWFATHKSHTGNWPLEQALVDHVTRAVLAHPEWKAFYAKPWAVTHGAGPGDETRVRSRIPRFTSFTDWDFDAKGGWLCASERD